MRLACTAELSCPLPLPPCRKLEDQLDQKTAELITLRKAAFEHNRVAAQKDVRLETAAEGRPSGEADWEIPAVFGGAAAAGPQQVPDSEWGGSEASSPLARRLGSTEWGGGGGFGPAASAAAVDSLQRQLEELRLQAGQQEAAAAEREAQWQQEAEALRARLQQAQQEARQQQQQLAQQQQQQQDGGEGSRRAAALAAQCDSLSKERDALRTILDRWAAVTAGCKLAMRSVPSGRWGGPHMRCTRVISMSMHLPAVRCPLGGGR